MHDDPLPHPHPPLKTSKSSAKGVVKQCLAKLQALYVQSPTKSPTPPIHSPSQRAAYLQVIECTYQICFRLGDCGTSTRASVDLADIIGNNFVLGLKMSNDFLLGGFVYLAAKYLNEGPDCLLPQLQLLMQLIKTKSNCSPPEELSMAIQQVRFLILPVVPVAPKAELLIENSLNCLSSLIETRGLAGAEESFYHTALRATKVCKLGRRVGIYKQLLGSYFRYVSQSRATPGLDICKLLLGCLCDEKEASHSCSSASRKQVEREQELTGFLIRKCFGLIAEHYKKGFYVEDQGLKETVEVCLAVELSGQRRKNASQILHALLQIKKVEVLADSQLWMRLSVGEIGKATSQEEMGEQFIMACKFIASCYLYVEEVVAEFQSAQPSETPSAHLPLLSARLSEGVEWLLGHREQVLVYLWHDIINCLHGIKSEVFSKCSRKCVLEWRPFILKWAICAQIQDTIISHPLHRQATNDTFVKHQLSNAYILVVSHYLMQPPPQQRTSRFGHGNTHGQHRDLLAIMKRFEGQASEAMYRYWDDLLNIGASLWVGCTQVQSLEQVSTVLSHLIKCRTMAVLASRPPATTEPQRGERLPGLINLLITFLRQPEGELKIPAQRLRASLMMAILREFIGVVVKSAGQAVKTKDEVQPYEEACGYALALAPIVQDQLGSEDRRLVARVYSEVVQTVSFKALNKIRGIYHKTVAIMIQGYGNSKSHSLMEEREMNFKGSVACYLESYAHLYPRQVSDAFKTKIEAWKRPQIERESSSKLKEMAQVDYDHEYNKLLYVDFMQWVVQYCAKKELGGIGEIATRILQSWLNGRSLEDHLARLIKCMDEQARNVEGTDLELFAECMVKLIYQKSQSGQPVPTQTCKPEDEETQSTQTSVGVGKINIEFEVQVASLHISHVSELIVAFSRLCSQVVELCLEDKQDWFRHSKWEQARGQGLKGCKKVRSYGRFLACLTNLIGIAYSIGYAWSGESVLQTLCIFKLLLSQLYDTKLELYGKYAEMVFLGYAPKLESRVQEIKDHLARKEKAADSALAQMIELYLGIRDLGSEIASDLNQHLPKLLLVLQGLQHMHPHKPLVRSISGFIFAHKSFNEDSMIQYKEPLFPLTSCVLAPDGQGKSRSLYEHCSSQLEHRILETILLRVLDCLLMNHQISEFRSILKLAIIYFARARHARGLLLAISCHQAKTKHMATKTEVEIRRSQVQPIGLSCNLPRREAFAPLDMLSISDSLAKILGSLYGETFEKKGYDRFCELVLSARRRRTSMSFHLTIQHMAAILLDSVRGCGQIGPEVFLLLAYHACTTFESAKESLVYQQYLSLKHLAPDRPFLPSSLTILPDRICKTQLDREFLGFTKAIAEKLESPQTSLVEVEKQIVKEIKKTIPFSFLHAKMLQNFMVQVRVQCNRDQMPHEDVLLELALLMLNHNFAYKRMVETVEPIVLNFGQEAKDAISSVNKANATYRAYLSTYLATHDNDMKELSGCPHPLTILYPFHSRVYSISVQWPLLVTSTDRLQFEDHIHTIETLIANNSRLLYSKDIDPKDWWKGRDRVDRSMGKIVNEIDLWNWDTALPPSLCPAQSQDESRLYKFVYAALKGYIRDPQRMKMLSENSNVCPAKTALEDIILQVTRYLSRKGSNQGGAEEEENLLLLTHHDYTMFPFEASLHLSRARAVYRLPSTSYLMGFIRNRRSSALPNVNRANYLVNSGSDLTETERKFYRIKEGFPSWKGVVGRTPQINQYLALLESDLFLFMGHGNGVGHLRERDFYNKSIRCLMMLFGCSSVSMTMDKCQPFGFSHSNLINGAPAVLGCLWQVTDGDTDKVTENIFRSIGSQSKNLSRVLLDSRKKCRHQYLNGGALVLFGIPNYTLLR